MTENRIQANCNADTAILDRLMHETVDLACLARDYAQLASDMPKNRAPMPAVLQTIASIEARQAGNPDGGIRYTKEVSRLTFKKHQLCVTVRLTEILAWILSQKAVHAGELEPCEALEGEYGLAYAPICQDPEGLDDPNVPMPLRHLLSASFTLYQRIMRLDSLARMRISDMPQA